MSRFASILLLSQALGCAQGHAPEASTGTAQATWHGVLMGSSVDIEVFGPDRAVCERAVAEAVAEIERLDRMMTDWKPQSPLMEINYNAGRAAVAVPRELYFLIEQSVTLSRLTGGAFDITFAGAGKLWNWRAPDPQVPDDATLRAALADVGWQGLQLDPAKGTVRLERHGMRIGLGAIAPGYAGDQAMDRIRAAGIRDACVNISGDVRVIGRKDGRPWNVAIRHPRREGENIAVLPVSNLAVSTSGDYERFFIKDGRRYSHIIDPRTGRPADLCQSVTVTAPVLAVADALATGVFVLGPREGMALIEQLDGVEGMIVAADGSVTVSSGLKAPRR